MAGWEERFGDYVELLGAVLGHADRCQPLKAYTTGLLLPGELHATPSGIGLAIASGAVASGMGYAIWYFVLRGLTAARAATVQLSVPAIAALGGVALLSEPLTLRLVVASVTVLGGVAIVLAQRSAKRT